MNYAYSEDKSQIKTHVLVKICMFFIHFPTQKYSKRLLCKQAFNSYAYQDTTFVSLSANCNLKRNFLGSF